MRPSLFQFLLAFSLLFFFNSYFTANAQLIEQWRVELPQIPNSENLEFHFDAQGNTYHVLRSHDANQMIWTYYIYKISKDGILEWQIEEQISDFLNIFFESSGGDTLGNTYLLGNMIDSLNWGLRLPWVTKYSPNGTKLFMQVVETGYDYTPYVSAYTVAPSGHIFASGTVQILEPPTTLWDYGYSMIISPDAVKIADFLFNIQRSHAYQHPPLGPDLDENYLVGYGNYVGTSWDTIRRHFVGHDQFLGVRWMVSGNPTIGTDPLFEIYNYFMSKKGNIFSIFGPTLKKYSPYFIEQWTKTYNGTFFVGPENPADQSILIWEPDSLNRLACYNSDGTLRWRNNGFSVQRIGPSTFGPENDIYNVLADTIRRINYLTGEDVWRDTSDFGLTYATNRLLVDASGGITYAGKERVIKFIQGLKITKPVSGDKFIAGQKDTVKWEGGREGEYIKIKYSTDAGNNFELIDAGIPENDTTYVWDVPDDLLTTKAIIKIERNDNSVELAKSDTFKIKPYVITRLDENGNYIAYDITTDRWGFANTKIEMWPVWWWLRFNYIAGKDPFTGLYYPQHFCDSIFAKTKFSDAPDWISFVNTYGVNACYIHPAIGSYRTPAVQYWKSIKKKWGGSCFGIAISNALAFEKKNEFKNKYQNFPIFTDPITVTSDTNVIPVIMELFTHQSGNPHHFYRYAIGINESPSRTIRNLKQMLREDNVGIRTLSMVSNSTDPLNQGGHAIIAYKLKQDDTNSEMYYVYVYDNNYPNILDARILVDTSYNGGAGFWDPEYGWDGWEGNKWFYLRDSASSYLTNGIIPKIQITQSPFMLNSNELKVHISTDAFIIIEDNVGNQTGYTSGGVITDIPNSVPLIVENGGIGPPYGYHLPTDNYSIVMNNFTEDTTTAFFFTGNKSFEYERFGAAPSQTDRIFFDGGVSVTNPDNELKIIKLLNIVSDTTQVEDRLFVVRHLDLLQNDSVKIENVDNNKLKLISYGSAKDYGIGLEYTSESNFGLFGHLNVVLSANTTHTFIPNWSDITNSDLTVYVDIGNNGTIEDTLYLQNQVTSVGDGQGLLIPKEYKLEQNYPNPFNPSTKIIYSVPQALQVQIKVFDVLGNEIETLVNEEKQIGTYELTWYAENLPSGVYFYQLKAGDFIETKKMILIK